MRGGGSIVNRGAEKPIIVCYKAQSWYNIRAFEKALQAAPIGHDCREQAHVVTCALEHVAKIVAIVASELRSCVSPSSLTPR
jgi:hypothetical protein